MIAIRKGTLSLRLCFSIIILITSFFSGAIPLCLKTFQDHDSNPSRLLRSLGAGAILALATIHIVPDAIETIRDASPFLSKFSGMFILGGIFFIILVELAGGLLNPSDASYINDGDNVSKDRNSHYHIHCNRNSFEDELSCDNNPDSEDNMMSSHNLDQKNAYRMERQKPEFFEGIDGFSTKSIATENGGLNATTTTCNRNETVTAKDLQTNLGSVSDSLTELLQPLSEPLGNLYSPKSPSSTFITPSLQDARSSSSTFESKNKCSFLLSSLPHTFLYPTTAHLTESDCLRSTPSLPAQSVLPLCSPSPRQSFAYPLPSHQKSLPFQYPPLPVPTHSPNAIDNSSPLSRINALVYAFEFSCIFHSVIIGIDLGVNATDFHSALTLAFALTLHQILEGLGLGSVLASAAASTAITRRQAVMMVVSYSVMCPIGVLIGIRISGSYGSRSNITKLVEGGFNGVAGGMLLYIALVQLIAEDLERIPSGKGSFWIRIEFFGVMAVGAVAMGLVGLWA